MTIMHFRRYIYIVIFVAALMSCSTTKYVGENQYLLNKVHVQTEGDYPDIDASKLKSYIRQNGNSRWFSAVKIPLYTYSLSGRDSSKWINRFLKSMGEPPVIYDSLLSVKSCDNLTAALKNQGYLGAKVGMYLTVKGSENDNQKVDEESAEDSGKDKKKKSKKKKKKRIVDATYVLYPGEPYYIKNVKYDIQDTAIAKMLCLDDTLNHGLKAGMKFDVNLLDNERKRITEYLVNNGFYHFHKDYITYIADTVAGSKGIDLTFVLHKYYMDKEVIAHHPQYVINSITYVSGDTLDPVIHLRDAVLRNNTYMTEGGLYSANDLQRTYNSFGSLQAVKYTNISFKEYPNSDILDCTIQLSTNKPNSISFQPEGTNTAGDLGAAASLTYQHRNLFKGSEQLSIEMRGAYEAIKGLEGYGNEDFVEFSVETKLTFPRFIAPFISSTLARRINATSEVSFLYDTQNRPEYHRRVLSVAWRYKWANMNHHDKYQIDLLDLNYVFMPWISDTFRQEYLENDNSRNAILRYNYEDLFIMKFGIGYSYNNGVHAIKANVETAGNLLALASNVIKFSKNSEGQNQLFRIAYAQYAKFDLEYTRNIMFDYNNSLVLHAGFGIAYPYGNSTILPFEKRYFSGGANSVRGWSVRGLGPGKYSSSDGKIDFINQTGDMKLDLNIEYRAHLFWKLNGAIFIDAGNIWTLRNYEDQPGGQFKFSEFWRQIAVSYGFGVRLNFDFFILRFDFGMKAVNPSYEDGSNHYPFLSPNLKRDLAFHFAVGLPF